MAKEYVSSASNQSDLGIIALSTAVFESIVELSLEDNPDVRICDQQLAYHPINCTVKNNAIDLTVEVNLKVGCNINEISDNTLKEIRYAIKQMTGYGNLNIDLKVRGFYL